MLRWWLLLYVFPSSSDYLHSLFKYYFTDHMKDKMLRLHLESVATNSEIPIILYNVPPLAGGVKLSLPLVVELARHPNIVGIKDTSGSIVQIAQLVQRIKLPIKQKTFGPSGKDDFYVFAGSGSYLLQALTAGADGGVRNRFLCINFC